MFVKPILKFTHNTWENPSLKNSILIGLVSFSLIMAAGMILRLFYYEESLKFQPHSFELGANIRTAIMIILVAPVLETLIHQAAVIGLLLKLRCNTKWSIICSAILFSYGHFVTADPSLDILIQMLPILPTGWLLGALYAETLATDGWFQGFKYTAVAHATHNCMIFITLGVLELLAI